MRWNTCKITTQSNKKYTYIVANGFLKQGLPAAAKHLQAETNNRAVTPGGSTVYDSFTPSELLNITVGALLHPSDREWHEPQHGRDNNDVISTEADGRGSYCGSGSAWTLPGILPLGGVRRAENLPTHPVGSSPAHLRPPVPEPLLTPSHHIADVLVQEILNALQNKRVINIGQW